MISSFLLLITFLVVVAVIYTVRDSVTTFLSSSSSFFLFTLRTPWGQGVIFIIISPFVGISIFVFLPLSPRRG